MAVAGGSIGVALLGLVVVTGYAGSPAATDNLTPTFVLIVFWVGVASASVLFGNVFGVLNPWRALGAARRSRSDAAGRAPIPRGSDAGPPCWACWPSSGSSSPPAGRSDRIRLATVIVAYSVLTLTAMAFCGAETWLRRGEVFAVYFRLIARLSVFETRNRRVGLRPPLSGLSGVEALPGTVAFATVMIGSVTYDRLSERSTWRASHGRSTRHGSRWQRPSRPPSR